MQRWFVRDLDIRSTFVARSFEEPLGDLLESKSHARIDALLERATVDERLYALALCDANGQPDTEDAQFSRIDRVQRARAFARRYRLPARVVAGAAACVDSRSEAQRRQPLRPW